MGPGSENTVQNLSDVASGAGLVVGEISAVAANVEVCGEQIPDKPVTEAKSPELPRVGDHPGERKITQAKDGNADQQEQSEREDDGGGKLHPEQSGKKPIGGKEREAEAHSTEKLGIERVIKQHENEKSG